MALFAPLGGCVLKPHFQEVEAVHVVKLVEVRDGVEGMEARDSI